MSDLFRQFLNDDEGSTAIEYSLLAALTSITIISGLLAFSDAWNRIATQVSDAMVNVAANAG